ncbi:MAG: hypothetical protein RLZZ77_505 [Bacteroidota bacterium]
MKSYAASFVVVIGMLLSLPSLAAWNVTQTAVTINNGGTTTNYAGAFNTLGYTTINNQYLGRFAANGTLAILNGEVRSTVASNDNTCTGNVRYRVYSQCGTAPAWSTLALTNFVDPAGSTEFYNLATNTNINLLSGLSDPGVYVLEISWTYTGATGSSTGCGTAANDGNTTPYRFTFDFRMLDTFTDANITANPVWVGTTSSYQITTSSDAAAGFTNSQTLRLNGPSSGGNDYISTPVNDYMATNEWGFWIGRRAQSFTLSNQVAIWLFANEANLTSATVDGYRLLIGDDTGGDQIDLQVVTNGVATTIMSSAQITNNLTDIGFCVYVRRDDQYSWTLFTSTLPTANGAGATAQACPFTASTVNHGSVTNSLYSVSGSGHFGFVCRYTTSGSARNAAEFDNIGFRSSGLNTTLSFNSTSGTVSETAGTYNVQVNIANPSATVACVARVTLTSGTSASLNNFTSQNITFPAGSSAPVNCTLTILDNIICNDPENYTLGLTWVSGGSATQLGANTAFALGRTDNDGISTTLFTSNFESGGNTGWVFPSANAWNTSNTMPLSGSLSLRHVNTGTSGTSYASYPITDGDLDGSTTTWKFLMGTDFWEPTSNTKMVFMLCADNPNPFSANGYAVGVNQVSGASGDPDIITLWKVTNGNLSTALITTTLDWNWNHDNVAFEVTRTDVGLWTLKVDLNGDFAAVTTQGTATNTDFSHFDYFGVRYNYVSARSGQCLIDDITITQSSCQTIFYSQATGNSGTAIWAQAPVGTPVTVVPNRYTTFIVQNGHEVNHNAIWSCNNFQINSGGTFRLGSNLIEVHGNWTNNGTFEAGTGTVYFRGVAAQTIGGSSLSRFKDVVIENTAGVSLTVPAELFGQLTTNRGTFNTNNNLTVLSSASGDGSIGPIATGANVNGNITLQRYIPTGPSYWVYVGSPILNQTLANWNDDIITTGFPGSDYPTYSFNSVYTYNEAATGGRNDGWVGATNVTNTLDNGKGYILYMNANSQLINTTGSFNKGTVNIPLSYNDYTSGVGYNDPDGWNLVTNLYPSYVDWQSVCNNSGSFGSGNGTYYVYHTPSGNYRSYNANSGVGTAGRFMPHSQGFFVQATAPGQSITFSESDKVGNGSSFVRSEQESQFIRLSVSKSGLRDEAVLAFVDGATNDFDENFDTQKWESPVASAPEIAMLTPDLQKLTLDARAQITETLSVPVYVDMPGAGNYLFSIDEMQNIPLGACVTIEDVVSGVTRVVEPNLTFTVSTSAPYTGNRMIIRIGAPVHVNSTNPGCNGSADAIIDIQAPEAGWNWSMVSEMGLELLSGSGSSLIEGVDEGIYTITMESVLDGCEPVSTTVQIADPLPVQLLENHLAPLCNLGNTGHVDVTLENAFTYQYTLRNALGVVITNGESAEPELSFDQLTAGQYSLTVQNTCETQILPIALVDPNTIAVEVYTPSLEIVVAEGETVEVPITALSANADGYYWMVNGTEFGEGEHINLPISSEGEYVVEVTASNSNCASLGTITLNASSTVGVDETNNPDAVTWLQNADGIWFSFHEASAAKYTIDLYNAVGQRVMQEKGNSSQLVHMNISNLAVGSYTFRIWNETEVLLTGKFQK